MRRTLFLSALFILTVSSSIAVPVANAAYPGQNGRIAYVTMAGDHRVISTVDEQGADPQPLIDLGSGRDAINPAWSRDGERIAFAGQETPGGSFVIYTANADGTGTPQRITSETSSDWLSDTDPTWSPDGESVAFVRTLTDGRSRIWTVEIATGTTSTIFVHAESSEREPSWSPDGTRIAFVSRLSTCTRPPCRWSIRIWDLEQGWFANPPLRDPSFGFDDWHHPDWSPDGTKIVASFGQDDVPFLSGMGLRVFDVGSGDPLTHLGPCHLTTEPSYSPDGQWVVLTATPLNGETGELEEPNLCALRTDGTGGFLLEGSPSESDAAWGAIPGSAPPIDTSAPTIEFRPDPSASEWLDASVSGRVKIVASDDLSLPSIACTDWEQPIDLITEQSGLTTTAVAELAEGSHSLACTTTDEAGNAATGSATYQVDLTPPRLEPTVEPTVVKVGDQVLVSAIVGDDGSGVRSVEYIVLGSAADELGRGDLSDTAWFTPAVPDLYTVGVSARDNAGWVTESEVPFVAYDPLAGATDGSGWIVPGGATADPGDVLPGLDGVQKASFGFTAQYKTLSSETPAGNLTFSYGGQFKLQSKNLLWLAVRNGGMAFVGGIASLHGMDGDFPFVAVIVDGENSGRPDRFELRVYDPGTNVSSPTPLFAASGDARGQIRITT